MSKMKFTESREICVPRRTIIDLLENCPNDSSVWATMFASGMTLLIKPTTQSEKEFSREEKMVYHDIQEHGLDDAVLWKNRWSL